MFLNFTYTFPITNLKVLQYRFAEFRFFNGFFSRFCDNKT